MEQNSVRNLLVITLSNIGDAILTTPVLSILRNRFPSARVSVVVSPKAASLFRSSRTVDRVILFDKGMSWFGMIKFVGQLRRERFDLIVDMRNTLLPFLLRTRYRTRLRRDLSSLSMRDRHLARLKPLMPVTDEKNNFDFFSEREQHSAIQKAQQRLPKLIENRYIVVAPGAGSALKRWIISGFREIIGHFQGAGWAVVLVGDEGERALASELERSVSKPLSNVAGKLTIRESAALIARAALVVANDSAIMHLGHELERPTVSIFGPTNERKYGRVGAQFRSVRLTLECAPCEQAQCRFPVRRCLDDLRSSAVIQACYEVLRQHACV